MRFTVSAVLALATAAFAQTADFDPITAPAEVTAGQTVDITWTTIAKYAGQDVIITLIGGDDQGSQVPLSKLDTVSNDALKYSWKVDSSLGAENVYGLEFKLAKNPDIFQYSNPFTIKAGTDGGDTDVTVTVTTATGRKTVTISSCPPTTTSTTSTTTTSTTPSSTPTPTSTWHTTTAKNTTVAFTPSSTYVLPSSSAVVPVPQPPPATTTAPATIPPTDTPGAAPRVGAASMALLGGLALAAFAL